MKRGRDRESDRETKRELYILRESLLLRKGKAWRVNMGLITE
jgi:hypothetical protein